ncbi:MAG: hypothetical protein V2B18_07770 [Pseudomonadota bacterium]
MRKLFVLAAGVLITIISLGPVNAGPNEELSTGKEKSPVQKSLQAGKTGQIRAITPDMNAREKVIMERRIMKRASESRNALMRKAATKAEQ